MSLLTSGQVFLANETNTRGNGGGNNNSGRRNRNNRDRNNGNNNDSRRSYENADTDYALMGSTYVPDDIREELMNGRSFDTDKRKDQQGDRQENKRDKRADAILDFCDTFQDNVNDYRSMQEHVIAEFPNVVGYLRSYYNNDTNPALVDAENRLIKLMSTTQFANVLASVLQNGDWNDGTYAKIWRSIAFALSVALETSHERMHAKVIQKYAIDILPRMWNPEINEMVRECGITKDLALDLLIAIPMAGGNWNGSSMDALYARFLDKMLDHAENNMDVLNYEVQGMLYDKLFGAKNKTALNIIGKYLVSEPIKNLTGEVAQAVYKEFIKMLYTKLDEYDVNEIAYVFRYVVKCRKENPDRSTTFVSTDVSAYENVRKGMLTVMDEDKDAMKYLA